MIEIFSEEQPPLAWLVAAPRPDVPEEEVIESLDELGRLAKTLGHEVRGRVVQRRARLDPARVLGPGKVESLKEEIAASRAEEPERDHWVLVDDEISPSQVRELGRAADALVMDRKGVILEIFHRHARTRAAKAQVELVRLAYLAPRLRELRQRGGSRQRGGIGGKGAGESAAELDRRRVRDRLAELRREIDNIERERATQRSRRQGLRRVALVGYTNAGKSTLMRALTDGEVYVADKLFATLDTTVRALHPAVEPRVLVSDTVGFIRKLPHDLVASFRSTLDEALEAGLLLHVVDASDPSHREHMATTEAVLAEIGAAEIPTLVVLNKCDRVSAEGREALAIEQPEAILVSATSGDDVARLHGRMVAFFAGELSEARLCLPHDQGALRATLLARAEVLESRYDEDGGIYHVRAPAAWLAEFQRLPGVRTIAPLPGAEA